MTDFDQLHVVSDLHLGGSIGFQIFDQSKELAGLVDYLKALSAPHLGLVLNGDVVDFLAEDDPKYLDPNGAVRKLDRIFADLTFAPVWQALSRFVSTEGRELIIVGGNHDVELSLPPVRQRLIEQLCGGASDARGRITLATDGAGFACTVRGARVLCIHGHEADPWNVVDYRQLLEVERALNRRQPPPEWTPNAGTKLVIDLMNDVKQSFPFVDLLKPETPVVPSVVLAVDRQVVSKLNNLAPVLLRLASDQVRLRLGLLGADEPEAALTISDDAAMQHLLAKGFSRAAQGSGDLDDLLGRVEDQWQKGEDPTSLVTGGGAETLGLPGMLIDRVLGRDPRDNLREALQSWLGDDRTFETNFADDTFRRLDADVGREVAFVVAGHTHLQRALPRSSRVGAYFNSGTWIRLIKLSSAHLQHAASFDPVFLALKAGTMQALDQLEGLVVRRSTVVSIEPDSRSVFGELRYMRLEPETKLEPVPNTRLGV